MTTVTENERMEHNQPATVASPMRTAEDVAVDRVGQYEMRIRFGERNAESDARWQRRSDVLASWLLSEWKRQQRQNAERN